jgi:hypothetical protein
VSSILMNRYLLISFLDGLAGFSPAAVFSNTFIFSASFFSYLSGMFE